MGAPPGERHGMSRLTERQVHNIRELYDLYLDTTYLSLANDFNVSSGTISAIIRRRTWKHI